MVTCDPLLTKKRVKITIGGKSLEFVQQYMLNVVKMDSKKRVAPELTQDLQKRNGKMDGSILSQCLVILKTLMNHEFGWVFNQPVDPIMLNIPDYLSVISEPMDLGTIKSKLEQDTYQDMDEFASDINLTFSNAMTYSPSHSEVHKMAQSLQMVFDATWKSLQDMLPPKRCKLEMETVVSCDARSSFVKNKAGACKPAPNPTCVVSGEILKRKGSHVRVARVSNDVKPSKNVKPPKNVEKPLKNVKFLGSRAISSGGPNSQPTDKASMLDVQVLPKIDHRAALLKQKYGDIILKAQKIKLVDQNKNVDPMKLQQEEKTGIASELKKQRASEREAARIARDKMVKTAELDINLDAQRELEILGRCVMQLYKEGGREKHPLEQFGLFIKDEWLLCDDNQDEFSTLNPDIEEGEIV